MIAHLRQRLAAHYSTTHTPSIACASHYGHPQIVMCHGRSPEAGQNVTHLRPKMLANDTDDRSSQHGAEIPTPREPEVGQTSAKRRPFFVLSVGYLSGCRGSLEANARRGGCSRTCTSCRAPCRMVGLTSTMHSSHPKQDCAARGYGGKEEASEFRISGRGKPTVKYPSPFIAVQEGGDDGLSVLPGDATQELEQVTALGYRVLRCRPCRRTFN